MSEVWWSPIQQNRKSGEIPTYYDFKTTQRYRPNIWDSSTNLIKEHMWIFPDRVICGHWLIWDGMTHKKLKELNKNMKILLWIHEINAEVHVNWACDKNKRIKKTFFSQNKLTFWNSQNMNYIQKKLKWLCWVICVHKCAFSSIGWFLEPWFKKSLKLVRFTTEEY